ncbi:hypothetical protein JXE04_04030 [Patescibacteria group bacterium]|nr:hypothetical protein [Patescibacteria group bacterium]
MERKTNWFIEPLNAFTNEVIAKELAKTADVTENVQLKISDGSFHSVFQVPAYSTIAKFKAGSAKFNLKFKVYCSSSKNAQVRLWKF